MPAKSSIFLKSSQEFSWYFVHQFSCRSHSRYKIISISKQQGKVRDSWTNKGNNVNGGVCISDTRESSRGMKVLVTDDDRLTFHDCSGAFALCVCGSAFSALRTMATDFKDALQSQYDTALFVTVRRLLWKLMACKH